MRPDSFRSPRVCRSCRSRSAPGFRILMLWVLNMRRGRSSPLRWAAPRGSRRRAAPGSSYARPGIVDHAPVGEDRRRPGVGAVDGRSSAPDLVRPAVHLLDEDVVADEAVDEDPFGDLCGGALPDVGHQVGERVVRLGQHVVVEEDEGARQDGARVERRPTIRTRFTPVERMATTSLSWESLPKAAMPRSGRRRNASAPQRIRARG